MKIQSINLANSNRSKSISFNANLHIADSVKTVIKPNEKTFMNAARRCDEWLRKNQAQVKDTLFIRKYSSLLPRVAFVKTESKISYAYPHEEKGYYVTERVKKYEDLEFQLGNRVCGFWFDENSSEEKLLSDFKNMFNYLHNK